MAKTASELAASYGFASAFFSADPELKRLIRAAVSGQWSATRFQGAFMNTKWYRSREASSRQWIDLMTRDPAEAKSKIAERHLELADRLTQFGLTMSGAELNRMAANSLQFSWSDAFTKNVLASMVHYSPGKLGGTPASLEMQLKSMANDYGMKLSPGQTNTYIQGLLSERYTEDNIKDFMRDSAKTKYQGMASWLDRGMTVREVAGNHIQSFARLLEIEPDDVDIMDPLMQRALQGEPNDRGIAQMETLYGFEKMVRRDKRWLRTKNAKSELTNAAMSLGKDWGLVG
jgi:hypothetical protein